MKRCDGGAVILAIRLFFLHFGIATVLRFGGIRKGENRGGQIRQAQTA